jgi:tetratricopeptide (TPR) repeat protein
LTRAADRSGNVRLPDRRGGSSVNFCAVPVLDRAMTKTLALVLTIGIAAPAVAQQALKQPEASPAASVSQTIGLTRIDIEYHRPAVNKRKVFGELVPYGEVWRAGANENTTIAFSSPVKIEGKPLAAGTYGVQMIPAADKFTVIFSTMNAAWGHYGYDAKEDALRVTVTPRASDFEERLAYRFDDPTDASATVSLHWDKLAIPFRVEVDTPAVVMASMRKELRGAAQFSWQPWAQAASYWIGHGGNLDEAEKMADRANGMQESFQTLRVRAAVAEKKGDNKLAGKLRDKAMTMATENDLNQYGYTLLFAKKVDEAIGIFERNVKEHPQSWNVYDSLGEAYLAKNDTNKAAASYGKALTLVKDAQNKSRIESTIARLKKK